MFSDHTTLEGLARSERSLEKSVSSTGAQARREAHINTLTAADLNSRDLEPIDVGFPGPPMAVGPQLP